MSRLVYLGSPAVAVPPLRALVDAGHDVALVVSQPDRRRGRGAATSPSPVKAAAEELGLDVSDRVSDVTAVGAELGVVVAFGRLVKPPVLSAVPMVNVHFSLLPRWRGAAPVERAILAGDAETGVCLMELEEGLDTGPVYATVRVRIGADESADDLRVRLAAIGTDLLVDRLRDGPRSLGEAVPQSGEATYAAKLEPEELHLDWAGAAAQAARVVRTGKAWTTFRGRRLIVRKARALEEAPEAPRGTLSGVTVATGLGCLELVEVQPEGKGVTNAAAWARGARILPGEVLGA